MENLHRSLLLGFGKDWLAIQYSLWDQMVLKAEQFTKVKVFKSKAGNTTIVGHRKLKLTWKPVKFLFKTLTLARLSQVNSRFGKTKL